MCYFNNLNKLLLISNQYFYELKNQFKMKKITLLFLFMALAGMLANAQTTLYTEDFESNEAYSFDGYNVAFAPSTKTGTWSGGVDLETAGDADINLRQGWGEQFNLKILTTGGAAVTIPNIDVAGYTNLNLSYEFVLENAGGDPSVAVAPFIEASIDGGASWVTLATDASGANWNKQQKSIALPTGTYNAISLRLNANNVTVYDAMFDNLIITGTVTQTGNLYPSYNLSPQAPDETGVSSNAVELAAKMHLGINFGNTMVTPEEGVWNAKVTESYVQFVKQKGFNTVRLSVGWVWGHLSDPDKMTIDPVWLNRVKEVVGWCVANDIYVIVNAHADLGWLEENVNATMKDSINAKQKALWEQIATTMRDFDEHLIFAGTNEPKAHNPEEMAILNGYHETFINAVRSTGGKNSYRVLVVQGPYTDPNRTADLMTTFPADNIPNKLMLEVHDYTPATFTILTQGDASWGNMVYYWGAGNHSTIEPERNATGEEETLIDNEFKRIKENFVDKGIPVILGEYAAWKRNAIDNANYLPKDLDKHNQSVDYWTKYVTKQAKANGIIPYYFETGRMLDRVNNVVKDQPLYDAIIAGYNDSAYVTLANRATGLRIDGMGRTTNGSNCGQWPSGGSFNQQWIIETVGNYVMLKNRATGLYLDGMYGSSNGSVAGQYSYSGSDAQYWTRETVGSYVKFKNKATGLYLDGMGSTTNGDDLYQWSESSSFNQQWSMNIVGQSAKMSSMSKDEISEESNFSINFSPNPFVNDFKVEATKLNEPIRVSIFDVTGKKVEAADSSLESGKLLMGSSLKPGFYIVLVEGVNLSFSKSFKIIKK
jgi:aryl-phospho-beta-D-glucosidase BglC (GH1 family)